MKARHSSYDKSNERLVEDAYGLVSEYLSSNLIGFLRERYPFFYFEETETESFNFTSETGGDVVCSERSMF